MNPFLGEIMVSPYDFAPTNWAFCDGRLLQIDQYRDLYRLLGTKFGGNGIDNFALPDLRGRCPIGVGKGQDLSEVTLGEAGGNELVELSSNQIPSLSAQVAIPVNTATPPNPVEKGFSQVPSENCLLSPTLDPEAGARVLLYGPPQEPATSGTLLPFKITTAGGGVPVDVRNPFLGLNFIICVKGFPPPRG